MQLMTVTRFSYVAWKYFEHFNFYTCAWVVSLYIWVIVISLKNNFPKRFLHVFYMLGVLVVFCLVCLHSLISRDVEIIDTFVLSVPGR